MSVSNEDRLNELIAAWLDAEQAGRSPSRERLLAENADLADELAAFFADHDAMKRLSISELLPGPCPPAVAAGPGTVAFVPGQTPRVRCAPPAPGSPFGNYDLIAEIDRGGMGVVYKARQRSLNRTVALKMILGGKLASPADVQRFYAEAEAAANLHHPNIVAIHEVGEHEGQHYFSMEFVDGESLEERLAAGPLPPRDAAALLREIALAVDYAHRNGVIHRDLKPANILLDSDGRPRITDFGLARRTESPHLTATGMIVGTPAYMSPEQASANRNIGPQADVYSLGAVLYALLTGGPPFRGASDLELVLQLLENEPVSPRRLNRVVDRNLETICLKCLEKEPQHRYAAAKEMADDLGRYLDGEPIVARPQWRFRRWLRRRPALATTWLGLLLFYLNHLVVMYALPPDPDEDAAYLAVFNAVVTGICAAWAAGALMFQSLARRRGASRLTVYGWATMEIVLFTALLLAGHGPLSSILIGYPVLVAGAALRFSVPLLWYVAGTCMACYLGLLADAWFFRPELFPEPKFVLPFLLSMGLVAMVQRYVLKRVRRTGNEE